MNSHPSRLGERAGTPLSAGDSRTLLPQLLSLPNGRNDTLLVRSQSRATLPSHLLQHLQSERSGRLELGEVLLLLFADLFRREVGALRSGGGEERTSLAGWWSVG